MTLAVPRSNWQIQENRFRELSFEEVQYKLTRTYQFTEPRAPAAVSTLEISCYVSIEWSDGSIYAFVDLSLRPHVYLGLGQLPVPEEGMITAPFFVWLVTEGEGTEESPLMQGGGCKVSWYSSGDEHPDDPELAEMRVIGPKGCEIPLLRALGSGKEMTFTIMGDTAPKRKLQLRLPNDGQFGRAYDDICNRLRRGYESRDYVRESRAYERAHQQAIRGDGLMGFLRRLFN
jgi:hypothetical protein